MKHRLTGLRSQCNSHPLVLINPIVCRVDDEHAGEMSAWQTIFRLTYISTRQASWYVGGENLDISCGEENLVFLFVLRITPKLIFCFLNQDDMATRNYLTTMNQMDLYEQLHMRMVNPRFLIYEPWFKNSNQRVCHQDRAVNPQCQWSPVDDITSASRALQAVELWENTSQEMMQNSYCRALTTNVGSIRSQYYATRQSWC